MDLEAKQDRMVKCGLAAVLRCTDMVARPETGGLHCIGRCLLDKRRLREHNLKSNATQMKRRSLGRSRESQSCLRVVVCRALWYER